MIISYCAYNGIIVGNIVPFDMSRVSLKYYTRPIFLALSSLPVYMAVGHIRYKLATVMQILPLGQSANGQLTLILALPISERHGMAMANHGMATFALHHSMLPILSRCWCKHFAVGFSCPGVLSGYC